jgi:hypothetical protein
VILCLLLVVLFHFSDEFLQVIHADFLAFDQSRHGAQVGLAKELVDHASQRAAAVFLAADARKILEAAGRDGLLPQKPFSSSIFIKVARVFTLGRGSS